MTKPSLLPAKSKNAIPGLLRALALCRVWQGAWLFHLDLESVSLR